jgi:hypothetical protein
MFHPDGSFSGLSNDRAQQASLRSISSMTRFLQKKKYSDISFSHCCTHAIDASASTTPPAYRWPSPTRRPSGSDTTCPLRLAAVVRPSHAAHSCPSQSPILRRSLPPVTCAARPAEPSSVLLAMVVVVVFTPRQFRP